MDNCLTIFTGELDEAFDPETLFPRKKVYLKKWLKRKFIKERTAIIKIKKNTT